MQLQLFWTGKYLILPVVTVQLNSNLTLARVRLAETRLIFEYTRELAASARMSLGKTTLVRHANYSSRVSL